MAFRIYLDEDTTDARIASSLRLAGVDCLTTLEAGNAGLDDEGQLAFAAAEGRALLSANRRDFFRLHRDWMNEDRVHCGILLISHQRMPLRDLVGQVVELQHFSEQAIQNAILFVNRRTP